MRVCVCVSRLTLLHTFDVKNAVPFRIAVVRREDASMCLCCHGTPFCVEDSAACVCVCVCVCVVYKRIPLFFVSIRSEDASACLRCHGTPFCVEDASVCVCVCVVGKGIPFFFLSQSFEVKTLPCVSAVRELLCGQSVRPFLCRWKARLFSLLTWKASVCVWETRKYAQELHESNPERSVCVCACVCVCVCQNPPPFHNKK